ncbi:hypothetical protein BR93DRAFT_936857 [Coniochaeta sp. PMI_546]|nr:hypothetical protein BR93DRAFT_936857 [Coniochaeta sp. PMI_546]
MNVNIAQTYGEDDYAGAHITCAPMDIDDDQVDILTYFLTTFTFTNNSQSDEMDFEYDQVDSIDIDQRSGSSQKQQQQPGHQGPSTTPHRPLKRKNEEPHGDATVPIGLPPAEDSYFEIPNTSAIIYAHMKRCTARAEGAMRSKATRTMGEQPTTHRLKSDNHLLPSTKSGVATLLVRVFWEATEVTERKRVMLSRNTDPDCHMYDCH